MQAKPIHRTATIRKHISNRLKLILGQRVRIGNHYKALYLQDGSIHDEPCQAIFYDGCLLIRSNDKKTYTFLYGDIAAWRGKLYAHCFPTTIYLNFPISQMQKEYAEANGLNSLCVDDTCRMLRSRFPKIPEKMRDVLAVASVKSCWSEGE